MRPQGRNGFVPPRMVGTIESTSSSIAALTEAGTRAAGNAVPVGNVAVRPLTAISNPSVGAAVTRASFRPLFKPVGSVTADTAAAGAAAASALPPSRPQQDVTAAPPDASLHDRHYRVVFAKSRRGSAATRGKASRPRGGTRDGILVLRPSAAGAGEQLWTATLWGDDGRRVGAPRRGLKLGAPGGAGGDHAISPSSSLLPEGCTLEGVGGQDVDVGVPVAASDFQSGRIFAGAAEVAVALAPAMSADAPAPAAAVPAFRRGGAFRPPTTMETTASTRASLPAPAPVRLATMAPAAAAASPPPARSMHDLAAPGAVALRPRPPCPTVDGPDGVPPPLPVGAPAHPVVVDPLLGRRLRPHQVAGLRFLFDCATGRDGARRWAPEGGSPFPFPHGRRPYPPPVPTAGRARQASAVRYWRTTWAPARP